MKGTIKVFIKFLLSVVIKSISLASRTGRSQSDDGSRGPRGQEFGIIDNIFELSINLRQR